MFRIPPSPPPPYRANREYGAAPGLPTHCGPGTSGISPVGNRCAQARATAQVRIPLSLFGEVVRVHGGHTMNDSANESLDGFSRGRQQSTTIRLGARVRGRLAAKLAPTRRNCELNPASVATGSLSASTFLQRFPANLAAVVTTAAAGNFASRARRR
jgi:hypothetical protein